MVDIFGWLSELMAQILKAFYSLMPSYGWGIIFLTFLMRLVLFPISISQVRSMEKMKAIQPKLKEIQDKYKDKPEELQRRMMETYRENKVNPLGGCLPLLLQMPFFFALIGLLNNPANYDINLAKEIFFGIPLTQVGKWATVFGASLGNLILALLSAATTYLQQKVMSPAPTTGGTAEGTGSMQTTFLYIMPLFFGYITFTMAAAIGVYWVALNVIGIVQQILIVRFFVPPAAPAGEGGGQTRRKP